MHLIPCQRLREQLQQSSHRGSSFNVHRKSRKLHSESISRYKLVQGDEDTKTRQIWLHFLQRADATETDNSSTHVLLFGWMKTCYTVYDTTSKLGRWIEALCLVKKASWPARKCFGVPLLSESLILWHSFSSNFAVAHSCNDYYVQFSPSNDS